MKMRLLTLVALALTLLSLGATPARAQTLDWRLPPPGVTMLGRAGFYSTNADPALRYAFVHQAVAPLKVLSQYPELWDWAIVISYYGVEFREVKCASFALCAFVHFPNEDYRYNIVGINPPSLQYSPALLLVLYIHELQHIVELNHQGVTSECSAWKATARAQEVLPLAQYERQPLKDIQSFYCR